MSLLAGWLLCGLEAVGKIEKIFFLSDLSIWTTTTTSWNI